MDLNEKCKAIKHLGKKQGKVIGFSPKVPRFDTKSMRENWQVGLYQD